MSKPLLTWTVPFENGDNAFIAITDWRVMLSAPSFEAMSPLEACQLGMALQDASKEAGARRAKARR